MRSATSVAPAFLGRSATGDWELLGARCGECGETLFGRAEAACQRCGAPDPAAVGLGTRGVLWAFTVLRSPAPGTRRTTREEPLPRPVGLVEMTGHDVRVVGPIEVDVDRLRVGLPLRMVVTELYVDEDGTPAVGYGFQEDDRD